MLTLNESEMLLPWKFLSITSPAAAIFTANNECEKFSVIHSNGGIRAVGVLAGCEPHPSAVSKQPEVSDRWTCSAGWGLISAFLCLPIAVVNPGLLSDLDLDLDLNHPSSITSGSDCCSVSTRHEVPQPRTGRTCACVTVNGFITSVSRNSSVFIHLDPWVLPAAHDWVGHRTQPLSADKWFLGYTGHKRQHRLLVLLSPTSSLFLVPVAPWVSGGTLPNSGMLRTSSQEYSDQGIRYLVALPSPGSKAEAVGGEVPSRCLLQ